MVRETLDFVALVKAAPVLTRDFQETMCVAGLRSTPTGPEWVRLHPVPFRDLDDESRFSKYQQIQVEVIRPKSDRRPESWSPIHGTIRLGSKPIDTSHGWRDRRHLVDELPRWNMCDLVAKNRNGSGAGVPSLAVVKPIDRPRLKITERDPDQLAEWRRRAAAADSQLSLFDSPGKQKAPFEVVPWRFRYEYKCAASGCGSHAQTIVDWEALALYRRLRHLPDWRERMRTRFEDDMWDGRDSVLFVGNQEHPIAFLVLGVFWPPAGGVQGALPF